ncbi:MAG TPA: SOS response-associated peptidase [Solirubrobacteraceae bacterium]|nr:SOS response-associated peptidase [Solirubrobacteraceae bacterium]
MARRRPRRHAVAMCGRYTLTTGDLAGLADRFGAQLPQEGLERFNVAPTERIAIVAAHGLHDGRADSSAGAPPSRRALLARWGLVPSYAREVKGPPLINARSESVARRRPFAALVADLSRRCLIPADGFYEWLRPEDGRGARQPFHFRLVGGAPFAFAGLWCWSRPGEGAWLASATILTCPPNPLVARLHDRMPVILAGPHEEAAWLEGDLGAEDLPALCAPLDAQRMDCTLADPAVNRSGGPEGPGLLRAPAPDRQGTLL